MKILFENSREKELEESEKEARKGNTLIHSLSTL